MRTLGTRRTHLVAGAAALAAMALAAMALAGCSAGQVAETALKRPSNMGVNSENSNSSVLVRNLAVTYDDTGGYAANQPAPLQLSLFNQSADEIRVTVTSSRPTDGTNIDSALAGTSVVLVGASPSDSASPAVPAPTDSASAAPSEPAEPAAQPAVITLAPMGSATFLPGDPQSLQITGLSGKLSPGQSVYVTFSFSNGVAPLTVPAPVGVPLSPASRGPGIEGENVEE